MGRQFPLIQSSLKQYKTSDGWFLDPSLNPDMHQKVMGCIRGRDLACIQVWYKFCRWTILLTNQPTNQQLDT